MTLNQTMLPTERMFAGSLVETESRPGGLLPKLKLNIRPEDIEDPLSAAIWRAAARAMTTDWMAPPTPETLAQIMVQERGTVYPDLQVVTEPLDIAQQRQLLVQAITEYAQAGIDKPAGLNSLAASIGDNAAIKRLAKAAEQIKQIYQDKSRTSMDMYMAAAAALEQAKPNYVPSSLYTVRELKQKMAEMKKRQHDRLGKPLLTFPLEWSLNDLVPSMEPGLLYTLSGLTGRGKSSTLLQIALTAARVGKKVLYMHFEDDIERQIKRMARQLTGATVGELMAGDPRNKLDLLASRLGKEYPGLHFEHCPDQPTSFVRTMAQIVLPDVIIVDYLGKINIAPYMEKARGNKAAAMEMAVEDLKLIAENIQHQCVIIMGSQEAEHENGTRVGTRDTRAAEHKAQVVIELERTMLTETDVPEIVDGIKIAEAGLLSGFAYLNVVKNNDGSTGRTTGILHGLEQKFISLEYLAWQRQHPDEEMLIPVLREPDQAYYDQWEAKARAWYKLDKYYDDPKMRRKKKATGPKTTAPANDPDAVDGNDSDGLPF